MAVGGKWMVCVCGGGCLLLFKAENPSKLLRFYKAPNGPRLPVIRAASREQSMVPRGPAVEILPGKCEPVSFDKYKTLTLVNKKSIMDSDIFLCPSMHHKDLWM